MRGQVEVQQQVVLDVSQQLKAVGILGVVEAVQDVAQLRLQLQELLEGAAEEHKRQHKCS